MATTSLPAVDRPNADRWNAARSRQNYIVEQFWQITHYLAEQKDDILFNEKFLALWMQECKYTGLHVSKYASMPVCMYSSMQVCKNTSWKVNKYASMQVWHMLICRNEGMEGWKYISFQVCKYPMMQLGDHTTIWVCNNKYKGMYVCNYSRIKNYWYLKKKIYRNVPTSRKNLHQ